MANVIQFRARRFNALYALLTGAAHPELPTLSPLSAHLRKDLGLPEPGLSRPVSGLAGPAPTDRFRP